MGHNTGQSTTAALTPDGSRLLTPPLPSVPHVERSWHGMDLSHDPSSVFPGFATRADNLRLRFGKFVTRPGFQGRLATKHGSPIYGLTEYRNSDQSTTLLYDTGGRIFKLLAGASADAEITVPGSGTLNSPGAQYARLGLLYRVDGVSPLMRIDPTGGTTKLSLSPPTSAPSAALTSTALDDWSDLAHWAADTLSGAGATNRVVNGSFAGGSDPDGGGHDRTMPHWSTFGADTDWYSGPNGVSGTYALLDTPGEGMTSDAIANDAQSLDAARNATQFYVSYDFTNTDTSGHSSVLTTLIAYASTDGSGAEIGRVTHSHALANIGEQVRTVADILSFGEAGTAIGSVRLQFQAGPENTLVTSPFVGNIYLTPIDPSVSLASGPNGSLLITYAAVQAAGMPPVPGQTATLAGLHLRRTFAAPKDLTGANVIDIPITGTVPAGLSLKMRLQESGDTAWYDTNPVTVDAAGAVAYVDITTVPLAVRQACAKVEVVFTSDVTFTGQPGLTLGPLRAAGDLSSESAGVAFAPYYYAFTEIDRSGDATLANVIESNPSPVTGDLQPTAQSAQASLTLPAPVNASTTDLAVYRFGGVFSDGLGRLVGIADLSSSAVAAADPGLVSWDHTTRTFVDNTPDQWLEVTSAAILDYGRDPAPVGATAICAHMGRLWLAQGQTVYGSWLIQQTQQAGLYFNRVLDPEDPNAPIKGDTFTVGQNANDPVVAMVSLGQNAFFSKGYLVIFCRSSVYVMGGTGTADFYLESFLVKAGVGCVGGGAWGIVGGRIWFLSDDGVYSFAADFADPKSILIERGLLAPAAQGGCDPAAWAKSSIVVHDRRAHVCVPTPGDSAPTVKYVWDSRETPPGGWTRDTGAAYTGGCTLSGGSAAGALYWAGQDGQVYQEAGAVDKSLSTSAGTGIAYALATRGLGQEGEGLDFWRERQASWWMGEISTAQTGGQVTCGLSGEGVSWTETHYLNAAGGLTHIRKDVPSFVRGRSLEVTLSGTATTQQEIQALGAITAAGGLR